MLPFKLILINATFMEMKSCGGNERTAWNLYAPGMWNSVKAVIASLIGARHRFALFCIDSEISIALPRGTGDR